MTRTFWFRYNSETDVSEGSKDMTRAAKTTSVVKTVLSIAAAVLCGSAIGVGIFGVQYSALPSYLNSNPETCINCHVMQDQYDAWQHGSHATVATCKDCHLPHDNIIRQLYVEAEDGLLHAYKFTTGDFPANIVIRESSLEVVNSSCIYCHSSTVSDIHYSKQAGETITCTRCHSQIGHD